MTLKQYINEILCSTTPSGPVDYRFRVRAVMCGALSTDWVECLILDVDDWVEAFVGWGTTEKIKIYYQASSDSFRMCNLKIPAGEGSTVISRTCDEEGVSTIRCCAVIESTDTQVQYVHYRTTFTPVVGQWSDCLGRNFQEGDTGYNDMEATETGRVVEVLEDCLPKTCYHTKYATCTEVSPGVKVWIPGSVVIECLNAAPGTLNTWGWVDATTARVIREYGECYDATECGTGTPETPQGVLTCA